MLGGKANENLTRSDTGSAARSKYGYEFLDRLRRVQDTSAGVLVMEAFVAALAVQSWKLPCLPAEAAG